MESGIIIISSLLISLLILVFYFRRKYIRLRNIVYPTTNKLVNNSPVTLAYNDENQKPEIEKVLKDLHNEQSKRLELEKQLHIKEARFKLALEENNDGLWDWNIVTNEVYLSPRWISTLGFKNGEIAQKDCLLQNLLHPDDWNQALQKLEIILSGQDPNYENIIRIRAKSGDWLWIYDRGKVVEWGATGKPLRIMGTYTNLTEKKRQELIQQIQQRIGIILGATGDFNQALSGLLEEVFKIGGIDFGGVYIINHRTRDIELVCHQGLAAEIVVHVRKFTSESPLAKLISIGNSVFDHPERLQNLPNFLYSDTELQMVAIIPVKFENEVVAALMLGSQHLKSFSPADQLLLEAIADQLGGVIARVRTEKALKESQENFQRLFDTFKDFLLIFDIKGQIIRANPEVSSRLGFSPEELDAMNLHDLYVFEKSDEFHRLLKDTEKNDLVELSLPIRTAAGTFIPTETRITHSEWNDQPVFWGISRDISERQKAEIALKKRDRILSAVSTAAFILLKIRKFDQAINEVINILGKNIQPSRILLFQNSANLSTPLLQFEWYADEKYKNDAFISAQITYKDAGLGRWSAILSKGETIVGHCDKFPPDESHWLSSLQIRSIAIIPIFDSDHWWGFIRFDDCENQTESSSAELDALRSAAGLLGSAIERRKIEEELHKYRGHLEELVQIRTNELSEVNTELKAFAYSVSHDLRAPLRAMYGFSQVLIEDYGFLLDERGQDYAKRIESAAKRMENLIQDLLNYSSLSRTEIHFQPIDMNWVFENILLQLNEEIQQCQAQIEIIKPLPEVIGHQLILEQIFSNLLSNALKFVPADRIPQVKIWAEQSLKTAVFWISDNGIGIEKNYHDRIFKVFERLYPAETYPGTGIGLAIVRRGVDRLGGTLGLESTPGVGTKFWIRLSRAIE
ncbi:PAS domain S-box protein [candidate division KSB1 bacterium]|nr:PAS domain S-box protein [candidate division KSB1 bacterium]